MESRVHEFHAKVLVILSSVFRELIAASRSTITVEMSKNCWGFIHLSHGVP
jgi:hypothetical protein